MKWCSNVEKTDESPESWTELPYDAATPLRDTDLKELPISDTHTFSLVQSSTVHNS